MDAAGQTIEETEGRIAAAQELRDQLVADPQRPRYHFQPPAAWMNDINGTVYWNGRYHLFYQHNPEGAYWKWMQWGHASSTDLVHWTHHPIALTPTAGGPDRDGCFSGMAVLDGDRVVLVYHGVPDGTCLATSRDPDLLTWEKHPANPVVRVPQPGEPDHGRYIVYDPCAWKQEDHWYLLSGGTLPQGGDTGYLFRSRDMVHWEYLHPLYEPNPAWTELGEDCAVPIFFGLGDRHVLLFVSHKYGAQYYTGRYEAERFYPEYHARMNWAGGQLIAPMTMLDARGRRLFFGWICEARKDPWVRSGGWAGVMTLPRVLTMRKDGSLGIEPVEELQALRRGHRALEGLPVAEETPLSGFEGDCLELELTVQRGSAQEFGVKVRFSPDGEEQTTIVYSWAKGTLRIDTTRSSLSPEVVQPWPCPWGVMYDNPLETRVLPFHNAPVEIRDVRVQEAPLPLRAGERLKLRVFLDRSVLEVYANGRQCLTQRIYPIQRDSLGVRLLASGGEARVERVEAWEMMGAGT